MRKLIILAVAGVSTVGVNSLAQATAPEWNQYCGDAARTCKSEALGPSRPTLVPGWPHRCRDGLDQGSGDYCGPGYAVGGAGAGPAPSLFAGSVITGGEDGGVVFGVGPGGRNLAGGWPAHLTAPQSDSYNPPLVGGPAVYTSGSQRKVFAIRYRYREPNSLYGLNGDGNELANWPARFPAREQGVLPTSYPTMVEDEWFRDNPRIYVASNERQFLTTTEDGYPRLLCDRKKVASLHAFDLWGGERPGWPVATRGWLTMGGLGLSPFYQGGPVGGDDGSIYFASFLCSNPGQPSEFYAYGLLEAFQRDGQIKNGFPVVLRTGDEETGAYFNTWPVGAAVAPDGTVYVSVQSVLPGPWENPPISDIFAITPAGTVKHGWPVRVPGWVQLAPVIGDNDTIYVSTLNQRFLPDDVLQEHQVFALDGAGGRKPGWPVRVLDDENRPEDIGYILSMAVDRGGNVYFGHARDLYSYDPGGNLRPGWPFRSGEPYFRLEDLAISSDGTLFAGGSGAAGAVIYAFRSPRRCDPRWSDRRCPPTKVEGGVLRQLDAP